jgi:hypothetical protein
MSQVCSKCGVERPLDRFYQRRPGVYRKDCKVCHYANGRRWSAANPEKDREIRLRSVKTYQARHRERVLANRKRDNYGRRTEKDRLTHRISTAVRECLKGKKKGRKWCELLGYTQDELHAHIERQFTKGMSWENIGEWHIDHIVPLSSFTITGPDDPELRRAWALTNLRPLWASQNIRKFTKRTHLL